MTQEKKKPKPEQIVVFDKPAVNLELLYFKMII